MSVLEEAEKRIAVLQEALQFHAEEKHFEYCGKDKFEPESASGEPDNWMCGGSEGSEFQYENGELARFALALAPATTQAGEPT